MKTIETIFHAVSLILRVECRGGTKLNDDFSFGAHVAVMQDNNYCRGRIITKTGNGDNFLVKLII